MAKKIISVFKVLITAYIITIILLLITAFIMYKSGLLADQVRLIIMVVYGVATIVAGIMFGKIKGEKRVLNGAFIGGMYFLVLTIVSFVVNRGFYDDMKKTAISAVICLVGGILGGIMS